MKFSQAWGWLAAGVVAAGLNAAYHDGGFAWAHRIADRAQHVSGAVVALASGHADRFLAEAETLTARNDDQMLAVSDQALAKADREMARVEAAYAHAEAFRARAQAHCARVQAERARIESRIVVRTAYMRIPRVSIPEIHISRLAALPSMPEVNVPVIPAVRVSCSGMESAE